MTSLVLTIQRRYWPVVPHGAVAWRSLWSMPLLLLGLLITHQQTGAYQLGWWLLGGALGFTLAYTLFGFSDAWRRFIVERRGVGLYAQLLMLALATPLFYPVLAGGELFGNPVGGITRPVGVSLLAGAFLFGIGMQLAGACSSGTLVGLGRNVGFALTLVAIIAGATWASADYDWWQQQPTWFVYSLLREFGPGLAIVLNVVFIAALAMVLITLERRRHGRVQWSPSYGLAVGAAALVLLNFAALVLTGRPWVITDAFPLWGAKVAELAGLEWDFFFWEYWSGDARQASLENSLWQHSTSVMNIGIVIGALAASGFAVRSGRQPQPQIAATAVLRITTVITPVLQVAPAALLGGLLLGYGAVVGLGCNIGAFVGGVVSGSVHGWVWLLAAFAGSSLGVLLRPLFGLRR